MQTNAEDMLKNFVSNQFNGLEAEDIIIDGQSKLSNKFFRYIVKNYKIAGFNSDEILEIILGLDKVVEEKKLNKSNINKLKQ